MVVLTNKLQGIASLETYKSVADQAGDRDFSAVFDRLIQRDRQEIDELRKLLVGRLVSS